MGYVGKQFANSSLAQYTQQSAVKTKRHWYILNTALEASRKVRNED